MDITPIIEAVLGLIVAIMAVIIIPTIKQLMDNNLAEDEEIALKNAIVIAVRAAEQIYKTIPKSGDTKKRYVINYLEKQGFIVDTDEINALIEATVNELFPMPSEGE